MIPAMRAMVLERAVPLAEAPAPLVLREVPVPSPGPGEVLVRVAVCGVCRTDLDLVEGRLDAALPVIPGHQVVGTVAAAGPGVTAPAPGTRVGVAWIYSACGACEACRSGRENLCPRFRGTGRDADGGYAEYLVAPAGFVHPIPDGVADLAAAPLLCAGAVGYRAVRLAAPHGDAPVGLMGFGASAHLVLQLLRHRHPRTPVYAFARDAEEREFARALGAAWAGDIGEEPPAPAQAIIDTTPAWRPIVESLAGLAPGGRLVINAIRKEDRDKAELLRLDYAVHLWQEREVKSVANVTRQDVREFLALAADLRLAPEVTAHPLEAANQALAAIRAGRLRGAHVLQVAAQP